MLELLLMAPLLLLVPLVLALESCCSSSAETALNHLVCEADQLCRPSLLRAFCRAFY